MIHRYILHNREIRDAADPCLTAGQVGLLAGWGVFSTLRVSRGVLFAWERHFARMQRDATGLHVPFPQDSQWLQQGLIDLIGANKAQEATLRVVVLRNKGGLWQGPVEREFDLLALTTELTEWSGAVRLSLVPHARHAASRFAGAKTTSWAQNLTWNTEAHEQGFDEALLLNEHGEVSECTSANVFAVHGSTVSTPPLTAGCLPGITRELLLQEIRVPDLQFEERPLGLEDLESADEVFITSTTRDCLPVEAVEGLSVGGGGAVCATLRSELQGYRHAYVEARRDSPAYSQSAAGQEPVAQPLDRR